MCLIAMGCSINLSSNLNGTENGGGTETNASEAPTTVSGSGEGTETNTSSAALTPASYATEKYTNEVPDGYTLEDSWQSGSGNTGKTTYYRPPPLVANERFLCVHRVGESPDIALGEGLSTDLAERSGNHCALSQVDQNVGCALSIINDADLMNVPPSQIDTTTISKRGLEVERNNCVINVINHKPLYISRNDPSGYMCVHPPGISPRSVPAYGTYSNTQISLYCATWQGTIACSTEPITPIDLIQNYA